MKPTLRKVTWMVYTDANIYRTTPSSSLGPTWAWVAYGPRGSEAGVEETSDAAVKKAYAASMLLEREGQA